VQIEEPSNLDMKSPSVRDADNGPKYVQPVHNHNPPAQKEPQKDPLVSKRDSEKVAHPVHAPMHVPHPVPVVPKLAVKSNGHISQKLILFRQRRF
jgi:hypothetical protein